MKNLTETVSVKARKKEKSHDNEQKTQQGEKNNVETTKL